MKKRISQYQYEPLVTPEKWSGEERRFSQRLTQILDDLYAKYSALRQSPSGDSGGGEDCAQQIEELEKSISAVDTKTESNAEQIEALGQSVSAVSSKANSNASLIAQNTSNIKSNASQISSLDGRVDALEGTVADLQMKTFSCGAAKKLTLKFTHAPYGGCAVFVRSAARSALMLVAVNGTSATPTTASNVNNITLPTVAFTSSTNTLTITAATGVHMGVMLYGQVNDTLASATITNAA